MVSEPQHSAWTLPNAFFDNSSSYRMTWTTFKRQNMQSEENLNERKVDDNICRGTSKSLSRSMYCLIFADVISARHPPFEWNCQDRNKDEDTIETKRDIIHQQLNLRSSSRKETCVVHCLCTVNPWQSKCYWWSICIIRTNFTGALVSI